MLEALSLAFGAGPAFDSEDRRRALVYWVRDDPDRMGNFMMRRGLPAVPFKERTLVNRYLVQSGLYEVDPLAPPDVQRKVWVKQKGSGNGACH